MALTQISTEGVKDDAVTSGKIPTNAVGSSELADNAVDTAAIAADAVTGAKIADDAIDNEHIANNAVRTLQIIDNAINDNKIADSSVTTAKIANDAVTSAKIADEAVGLHKLPHGTSSNDGKFLRANNGADPTFETVTSTTINNNANNRVITGSDTANTLEGESNLTFTVSGSDPILTVQGTSAGHAQLNLNTGGTTDHCGVNFGDSQQSGIGRIQYTNSGDYMILQTNGAERMRITSTGKVGIGMNNPDDTLDVNGTFQVSSNSYQSNIYLSGSLFMGGTGSANEIDDYEEGAWTPTVTFGGGSAGQGYNYQIGRYIKIGRLVHCTCYVYFNDKGSSTGTAKVSGLPFATRNQTALYAVAEIGYWNQGSSSAGPGSISDFIAYGEINSTDINIQRQEMNNSTPAVNDATNDHFANNTDFMLAINYITN